MVEIKRVVTRRDWHDFISLPWSIYKDHPHWVPPLRIMVREILNTNKNPFFRHARMLPLLAIRDGRIVGRIAGLIDRVHNHYHSEQTSFFGFFECVNDQPVCDALFDAISRWAGEQGMDRMLGPVNPSTNHECGLLIEGFDKEPRIMMPYNPPYYMQLISVYGFDKVKDLSAWDADSEKLTTDRLIRIAERQKRRSKITVREVDIRNFDREIQTILDIYNHAWEKNWGFVPMDEIEFRHMAKDMKLILEPRLCLIAEVRGEPAAFGLTLPNLNQVLKKIESGSLFPTGIFKLLWYFFGPGRKSTVTESRLMALGIKKKYRSLGLGALLYAEYIHRSPVLGMPVGEASWILEDNFEMLQRLEAANAKQSRRYRLYQKAI